MAGDMPDDTRSQTILRLGRDRPLAHAALFRHRHPDATPPFHVELISLWHSRIPHLLTMAFREGGKSTIAEEAITLGACWELFRNALIIGSSEERAVDRLRAIKFEIENNEFLIDLYGELRGDVWNETKVILRNGVCLQALGRGQSLRGTKHLQWRPDFCFADDLEEEEHVRTPEARHETLRWFMSVLVPALDKTARVRVNATPLDRDSLPMTLSRQPSWNTKIYPIEYMDETGERTATWPGRYPLEWIDAKKQEFENVGLHDDYMREYMCVAEDARRKTFTSDMLRVEPRIRTWEPVYAMYDPARTTKSTSARTGWAVWSWVRNRLVVWDGGAGLWKPDEILNHIFEIDETYSPVEIYVEADGLEEFINQPLRHEQVKRGVIIPVVPIKAPKGKIQFISALQPFFNAREIIFVKDIPEWKQFLSFPSGVIDFPNALAYAPRLRPGQVIYEDFSSENVQETLQYRSLTQHRAYLCVNATQTYTTGVLVQPFGGALKIFRDWIIEGDPGSAFANLLRDARLELGREPICVAGPQHFAQYDIVGLRGAAAKIPVALKHGGAIEAGRAELRDMFSKHKRGEPAVEIAHAARWTLNGLAGGYCRKVDRRGTVEDEARDGPYRVLMEGLETFAGLLKGDIESDRSEMNYQRTSDGRTYLSALPGRSIVQPTKRGVW